MNKKLTIALFFLCSTLQLWAQDNLGYEYWIDDDYKGRVVSSGSSSELLLNVDVSTLGNGIHFFTLRARGQTGWGVPVRQLFYIPSSGRSDDYPAATRYEYWIDEDYAQRVSGTLNGMSPALTVDVTKLESGVHFFTFRSQNANGAWGIPVRQLFYIPSSGRSDDYPAATRYEYWIDEDYAQRVSGTLNGMSPALTVDVTKLESGVHFFTFRSQNANGAWGIPVRQLFYIPSSGRSDDYPVATSYEYWIDEDYAQRVSGTLNGMSPALTVDVTKLECGVHFFTFRSQNANGAWGVPVRQLFYIPESRKKDEHKIVGYDYAFNGDMHEVKIDTTTAFSMSNQIFQLPEYAIEVSDSCHFVFTDEKVTMSRNLDLQFWLSFVNDAGERSVPLVENYQITDSLVRDLGEVTLYSAFDVPQLPQNDFHAFRFQAEDVTLHKFTSSHVCTLRLFDHNGEMVKKMDQMTADSLHLPVGFYYGIVSNVQEGTSLYIEGVTRPLPVPQLTHHGDSICIDMPTGYEKATIRYTTEDTPPVMDEWTTYTEPFVVAYNCTVRAYAYLEGYDPSEADSLKVDWMTVAPVSFDFRELRLVLSTTTDGAEIHYTTDGTEPTADSPLYKEPLVMTSSVTVKAMAVKYRLRASAVTSYDFVREDHEVGAPVFSRNGNVLYLSANSPDAVIHYTLDGTTPTAESQVCTDSIIVVSNCIVKAIGLRENYYPSQVTTFVVDWFKVSNVTFAQNGYIISLSTSTSDATIRYALLDGEAAEQTYNTPLTLTGDCTIEAYAVREGYNNSDTTQFVFKADSVTVAAPVIASNGAKVCISTTMADAVIYYTIDGTEPTAESSVYTDSITVEHNCTVKAVAMRQNWFPSQMTTLVVDWFKVSDVQFAQSGNVVTLSTATANAKIFYTLSNNVNVEQEYTTPLTMTGDCTIEAWAMRDGYTPSNTTSFVFHAGAVTCSNPVFARNENVITISTLTDGASIYYTTDCTDPTEQNTLYSEAITVDYNMTIKAVTMRQNYYPSQIESFVVDWFKVDNVGFAQDGYIISLGTPTSGATIRYTVSNGEPGEQTYVTPLTLTGDCTIEAYAVREGYNNSDTTQFVFMANSVTVAAPVIASNGYKVGISTTTDEAVIYYTIDGTEPTAESTVYTDSITLERNCTVKAIAMRQNWFPSQVTSYALDPFKVSSVSFAQNGYIISLSSPTSGATIRYTVSNGEPGEQTYVTPLTLTGDCTIEAYAVREGYNNSDTTQFVFTANNVTVAAPVIVSNGYKVGISTTTDEAVIYYTIDGTEPTAESTVYTDSITVERNCTIKAIAMRQNWFPSGVTIFEFDAPIDATFDSNGVLAVGGSTTMTEALEHVGGRDEVAKTITAIVWNSSAALTNSDLHGLDNPNMLIFVSADSLAPANRDNIVVGDSTDYASKNIVLTDVYEGNGNFYSPKAFVAEMVSYTHEYRQTTEVGVSRGWETIALPFDVQTIMHEMQGVIAPFGSSASDKHFWLRQMTQQGLRSATAIQANWPYLISMPNSEDYPSQYNLAGRVTFSSQDVTVPVTQANGAEMLSTDGSEMIMMRASFQRMAKDEAIYALNVGEQRDNHPEGSVFESNYRDIRPFEAFTVHYGNGPAPQFMPIIDFNGSMTGIGASLVNSEEVNSEKWYDLNGRKLQKKPTQKGVYLLNGRKVVIR